MSLLARAKVCKTLVCLLQGLEGQHTTIELRNENAVEGTIISVDDRMNVHMKPATFKTLDGTATRFEEFYIRGIHIRFVHIPEEVDVKKTIDKQLKMVQQIGKKGKFENKLTNAQQRERKRAKADEHKERMKKALNM